MQTDKPSTTYWRLIKVLINYRRVFGLAIFAMLLTCGVEAVLYRFLAPALFDKGVIAKDLQFLSCAPWYILGIFLFRGLGDGLGKYCMHYVGRNTVCQQRIQMLEHLLKLPISFFDQHQAGQLISKINFDAEQVAQALSDAILECFKGSVSMLFLNGVMLSISWKLTIFVWIVAPIIALYLKIISRYLRRYNAKVQTTMAEVTHVTTEIIAAPKIIKSFHGAPQESQRIHTVMYQNFYQEMRVAIFVTLSDPIMQCIGAAVLAGFLMLATGPHAQISPGEFVGLFTALFGMIRPLKQISQVNNVLQRGIAAAASIHQLLDLPAETDTGSVGANSALRLEGAIRFEQVSLAYANNPQETVLQQVSFQVNPGQTVAIVGSSGSGKTSLVALLMRFYDYQSGNIYLDQYAIPELTLATLRQNIAFVAQETFLFQASVAENISYGTTAPLDLAQITQAAKQAHALEFIEQLPQGLHSILGNGGSILSGGQRQRIALARAFFKNAPILILDEATSQLDAESEQHIKLALQQLRQHRTTVIIAHRLATVESADAVLVLEQGKVVEYGPPALLLQNNARYAALQQMYTQHS
jgi:subfamily B ATP-binding cassette protein MsbA